MVRASSIGGGETSHVEERRVRSTRVRRLIAFLGPAATVLVLFRVFGRLGFNPTDDGHVLAQAWRVLHGQIPYRDFISARPVGSVLLHTIDFAIPMPLFEATRLVGIVEMLVIAVALAWLIYGIPPTRWGLVHYLGALGSLLVNIHIFPVMGWHTIDGLLFTSVGFLSLERGLDRRSRVLIACGLVSVGLAPLMKQSFALVPLLGVLRVALRAARGERIKRAGLAAAIALAPAVTFVAWLWMVGALPDAVSQIGGARAAWGKELSPVLSDWGSRITLVVLAVLIAVAALRGGSPSGDGLGRAGKRSLLARLGASTMLVAIPVVKELRYPGPWGVIIAWALIAYLLIDVVRRRSIDPVFLGLAILAWTLTLSWGWVTPDLIAGSIILAVLHRLWSRNLPVPGWGRKALTVGVVGVTVIVATRFVQARHDFPYRDRPSRALTASLVSVSSAFGGIRTNPVTLSYLQQMKGCIETHPASRVAILPDNPGVYPALGLLDPLAIDWLRPDEVGDNTNKVLASVRALDRRGDYLVLFQTTPAGGLSLLSAIPRARPNSRPYSYGTALGDQILARLHGKRFACGPFIGVYDRA